MGISLSNVWNTLFGNKEYRILLIGLDNAGKTTILYKMKLGETINTIPTIGFNVETVEFKKISFTMFDVGGQDKNRSLWKYYYSGTDAVIFVIDSLDIDRINDKSNVSDGTVEHELNLLLMSDELRNTPFLFFANKQDLPYAMKSSEIIGRLKLDKLKDRDWFVQGTCAISGEGIYQGLEWLSKTLEKIKKS